MSSNANHKKLDQKSQKVVEGTDEIVVRVAERSVELGKRD